MLGPLLAERFHLVFHRETRELPVFALLVAKGGPKIKEPGDGGDSSIRPDGEGGLSFRNWSMDDPAGWLAMLPSVGAATLRATLPEQLGLKLETQKASVEMLVIDHAEKVPTEN